jgi:transposase
VPNLGDLSREELIALVLAQMDRITELADKVAKLEHLLSRNSGNSSMPPSLDDKPGGTPPKNRSTGKGRATPKRARGKQKGTPGANLSCSDAPDDREDWFPQGACGSGLWRGLGLPLMWGFLVTGENRDLFDEEEAR